jgi:hypothetical protein
MIDPNGRSTNSEFQPRWKLVCEPGGDQLSADTAWYSHARVKANLLTEVLPPGSFPTPQPPSASSATFAQEQLLSQTLWYYKHFGIATIVQNETFTLSRFYL